MTSLPAYDPYGAFGASPSAGTVSNPLMASPGGASANPLMANPAGTAGAPSAGSTPYNITPGSQSGSGMFGNVPGTLSMPDPYSSLSGVMPGLPQDNQILGNNIMAELSGELTPSTLSALTGAQQQFGIGGNINTSPMSMGLTDTQLQNEGIQDWNNLLPLIAQTQTVSPALETEIAQQNAVDEAAPDPLMAGITNEFAGVTGAAASKLEGGAMGGL